MINNYTAKAEKILLEPSDAKSIAKKIKGIGYVQAYDMNSKHNGRKTATTFWIQALHPKAQEIVEDILGRKLDWK